MRFTKVVEIGSMQVVRARQSRESVTTGENVAARSSGPISVGAQRIAAVARPSDKRGSFVDADYLRSPKSSSVILRRSRSFDTLVIQLSIDPDVSSIRYVDTLSAVGRRVKVGMLIAQHDEGRFAYELVDEAPIRDLDNEGLLQIALEENNIRLVEVDRAQLNAEPRAGNCFQIWRHRNQKVDASTRAEIDRALKDGPLTIRQLGTITRVSNPLTTVCALVWSGTLALDLSQPLSTEAILARRMDRQALPVTSEPLFSNRRPR